MVPTKNIAPLLRHAFSLLCVIAIVSATCFPTAALAATSNAEGAVFAVEGLTYKITGNSEVSLGSGAAGDAAIHDIVGTDVTIPSTVVYGSSVYTVTSIAPFAFQGDTSISSIRIPPTVKSIGRCAFSQCGIMDESTNTPSFSGLRHVYLSSDTQLRFIGDQAFYSCYNLESFVIPASVLSLGQLSFANCFSFTSLQFEEGTSISEIGEGAFCIEWQEGFAKPKEWTSSDPYTEFDEEFDAWDFASTYALSKTYGGLETVTIPASVLRICDNAFANQRLLSNVTFEADSMEWLGDWAFAFCNSLTQVSVPSAGYIKSADEGWLDGYGEYAFACCSNLRTFIFAGEIKAPTAKWICYRMFDGCINLDQVVFTYNTCVPAAAYGLSPGRYPMMIKWGYNSSDPTLYYRVGFCENRDEATKGNDALGWAVLKKGTEPCSLQEGPEAFSGQIPPLPDGFDAWALATRDGERLFSACEALDDVAFAFPVKSTDLGYGGLRMSASSFLHDGSEHRPEITVIDATNHTLASAEYELSWQRQDKQGQWVDTLDFSSPGSVRAVATGKGKYTGCAYGVYSIDELAVGATIQYDKVTYSVWKAPTASQPAQLQVGDGDNSAINPATEGIVEIPSFIAIEGTSLTLPVTGIASCAFGNTDENLACKSITEVLLPESITSIGNYAFANMSSLERMTLPASLEEIGIEAFTHCTALSEVVFEGASMRRIGTSAFSHCTRLRSVELPAVTDSMLGLVFQNCSMLSSVSFKGKISGRALGQFDGCKRLASVSFSDEGWSYPWEKGTRIVAITGNDASKATYQTTAGSGKATYLACRSNTKTVAIPTRVSICGQACKVTGIASKALSGRSAKTLKVESKTLSKSSIKGCLKGSKITQVRVPASKLKDYKKVFTSSACGKKVSVVKL